MTFTTHFLLLFLERLLLASPIVGGLILLIVVLGLWAGRLEGWSWLDALYWACITGTTVGYGDMAPQRSGVRTPADVVRPLRRRERRGACDPEQGYAIEGDRGRLWLGQISRGALGPSRKGPAAQQDHRGQGRGEKAGQSHHRCLP